MKDIQQPIVYSENKQFGKNISDWLLSDSKTNITEFRQSQEYSSDDSKCEICDGDGYYFVDSYNPESNYGHDEVKINCLCGIGLEVESC